MLGALLGLQKIVALLIVPFGTTVRLVPAGTVSYGTICGYAAAYQKWRISPVIGRKHGYPKNRSDRIGTVASTRLAWILESF